MTVARSAKCCESRMSLEAEVPTVQAKKAKKAEVPVLVFRPLLDIDIVVNSVITCSRTEFVVGAGMSVVR